MKNKYNSRLISRTIFKKKYRVKVDNNLEQLIIVILTIK